MRTLVLGLLMVSLLISGCTIFGQQEQNSSNNTTVTAPPPPAPKPPSFSITSPSDGLVMTIAATDNSTDLDLTLSTSNLVLKSPGGAAKKGEGHFQVVVDGGDPVPLSAKAYTIPSLPPGNHTIVVTLYNNDNTPYSPIMTKQVAVDIEKEAPLEYVPQNYTVSIEPGQKVGTEDFNPANLTVMVGDSVTWVNNGSVPQSATCSQGGKIVFDTKTLGPGKSATITFNDLLECDYYSSLFRAMEGHISVVANSTG
jgi:plastocyanin